MSVFICTDVIVSFYIIVLFVYLQFIGMVTFLYLLFLYFDIGKHYKCQHCDIAIEKPLEMPNWNLLSLRRICLFVYVCDVTKNNITKPHDKKFDGILVTDDKKMN